MARLPGAGRARREQRWPFTAWLRTDKPPAARPTRWGYLGLVGAVAVERGVELVVARRHSQWARNRGGREFGAGHYPVMVLLHSGLLVACAIEHLARGRPRLKSAWLMAVIAAQGLRWWCIRTLGPAWNTRVIVVPGHRIVTSGPYRFLPHPNYLAVAVEGMALPMSGGANFTAAAFSVANGILLRHRIAVEEAALATASDLDQP